MLRRIRIAVACLFFVGISLLFVDGSGTAPSYLSFLASWQFLPALRAGSFISLGVLLLVTLLFGRVYCSTLCPLGVLQDIIGRLGKKTRFRFSPAKKKLRWIVFAVFVLSLVAHLPLVFGLLEPFSAFGRIASSLLAPVWATGSNALAYVSESTGSFAIGKTPIWLKGISTIAAAVLTLVVIGLLAWKYGRTWCNTICPVGTLLGLISRVSAFRPSVSASTCTSCQRCERGCKASCIDSKTKTVDCSRCVGCFNCLDFCKNKSLAIRFAWNFQGNKKNTKQDSDANPKPDAPNAIGKGRRAAIATALGAGLVSMTAQAKTQDGNEPDLSRRKPVKRGTQITPPGSWHGRHYQAHCTGCQLCVAACPNQVLRASDAGLGMFQPTLSFERGYCRTNCVQCSTVCPTGAIRRISVQDRTQIQVGIAAIQHDLCAITADNIQCNACFRVCPTNAITMEDSGQKENNDKKENSDKNDNSDKKRPVVNLDRCIGCGACEYVCPVRPASAIRVEGNLLHKRL